MLLVLIAICYVLLIGGIYYVLLLIAILCTINSYIIIMCY